MEINNCPTCGGKVIFSPEEGGLKCVKCGKVFPINLTKEVKKKPITEAENDENFKEWENSSRAFTCTNCGARIVLNDLEMSNRCQYCNTSSLIPIDELPGLKPDIILPFKISKKTANQAFRVNIKKKFFLPRKFKKNIPNTEIGGTYFSAFTFGLDVFASYYGVRTETSTVYQNGETRTVTEYINFSGNINHQFSNIVVEASDKLNQMDIAGIQPYNFDDAFDYNSDLIKGYYVGYYNKTVKEACKIAKEIAEDNIKSIISNRYDNIVSLNVSTSFSNEKYNYALLPVYYVNFKYKDKSYLNLMNGQNGKVYGKVPRSATKISIFSIIIALIIIGVPLLTILLI